MSAAVTCPECAATDAIGHEVSSVYDGVLFWQCGSCGLCWSRDWSGYGRRQEIADKYVAALNEMNRVTKLECADP